jgi:hypothetical protein
MLIEISRAERKETNPPEFEEIFEKDDLFIKKRTLSRLTYACIIAP